MHARAPYVLYRRSPTAPWYVDFVDREGRRVRQSTKEVDKVRAHVVARDIERRLGDPTYTPADEATFRTANRALLEHLKNRGRASRTLAFYDQKLRHVSVFFGPDASLTKVTAASVDDYARTRKGEGATQHTVAKELTALRMLLKVARRRGEYDKETSQVMPVGFATGYVPRTRRVTIGEAWDVIKELPEGPSRYTAFVCATTARDSAVGRAVFEDLTPVGIRVRETKTKAGARIVPLTSITKPFAEHAFRGLLPGSRVASGVGSVRHAYDRACKRLRLAHLSPNDFRRSVAHWHLEAGVPRDIVAAFMGHTSTKMLDMVYGRLDGEQIGVAMARVLGAPTPAIECAQSVSNPVTPGEPEAL